MILWASQDKEAGTDEIIVKMVRAILWAWVIFGCWKAKIIINKSPSIIKCDKYGEMASWDVSKAVGASPKMGSQGGWIKD